MIKNQIFIVQINTNWRSVPNKIRKPATTEKGFAYKAVSLSTPTTFNRFNSTSNLGLFCETLFVGVKSYLQHNPGPKSAHVKAACPFPLLLPLQQPTWRAVWRRWRCWTRCQCCGSCRTPRRPAWKSPGTRCGWCGKSPQSGWSALGWRRRTGPRWWCRGSAGACWWDSPPCARTSTGGLKAKTSKWLEISVAFSMGRSFLSLHG